MRLDAGVTVLWCVQTFVASRRMAAPVQPAAAAAAALSAATAIPPPTSVQQKLEQLQARSEGRYRQDKHHDYHPDDDRDDGQGTEPRPRPARSPPTTVIYPGGTRNIYVEANSNFLAAVKFRRRDRGALHRHHEV